MNLHRHQCIGVIALSGHYFYKRTPVISQGILHDSTYGLMEWYGSVVRMTSPLLRWTAMSKDIVLRYLIFSEEGIL